MTDRGLPPETIARFHERTRESLIEEIMELRSARTRASLAMSGTATVLDHHSTNMRDEMAAIRASEERWSEK